MADTEPTTAPAMISRELIVKKLADFRKQHQQSLANTNALEGAIQACEQLLADAVASEH